MVTYSADRALHVLVAGISNAIGKWICQQWSLCLHLLSFA
jgi:hypothetical protein